MSDQPDRHITETIRRERFTLGLPLGCLFGLDKNKPRFTATEIVSALSPAYVFGPECLGPLPSTEPEEVRDDD